MQCGVTTELLKKIKESVGLIMMTETKSQVMVEMVSHACGVTGKVLTALWQCDATAVFSQSESRTGSNNSNHVGSPTLLLLLILPLPLLQRSAPRRGLKPHEKLKSIFPKRAQDMFTSNRST